MEGNICRCTGYINIIKSVKDAVKFALGFEKETLLYFMELRKIVKEKEVMDEVINEEKSHIMWLSTFMHA